jgi:hypothetical protein
MARFEYGNDTIQELYVQTYTASSTAVNELRVLRQPTAPDVLAGGWTATATTLGFDTLVGTLPPAGEFLVGTEKIQYGSITWTNSTTGTFNLCKRGWESTTAAIHAANAHIYFGDAFAWINTAVTDAVTTIPFVALDRPGQIPETGVIFVDTEWIYYGGLTYTNVNKTAGNLLYCFRGYNGTTAAAHDGSVTNIPIRFEHIFKEREYVSLHNYATGSEGVYLYYGFNPAITFDGDNALPLTFGDSVTLPLSCRNRIYVAIDDSTGRVTGPVAIAEWR